MVVDDHTSKTENCSYNPVQCPFCNKGHRDNYNLKQVSKQCEFNPSKVLSLGNI